MTAKINGGSTGKGFKPGKSGNPAGRPKIPEDVREAAKAYTLDAIKTLVAVCNGKKVPHAARVTAAEALLNRAWGRPSQAVEVAGPGPNGEHLTISRIELVALK